MSPDRPRPGLRRRPVALLVPLLSAIALAVGLGIAQRDDGDAGAGADPTSAYIPIPTDEPELPPELALRGAGTGAVPFAVALTGSHTAAVTHDGEGRFVVRAVSPGGAVHVLAEGTGRTSTTVTLDAPAGGAIEGLAVEAAGPWTVTIR